MTSNAIGYFGDLDTFIKDTELIGQKISYLNGEHKAITTYITTIINYENDTILGLAPCDDNSTIEDVVKNGGVAFVSLKKLLNDNGGFALVN